MQTTKLTAWELEKLAPPPLVPAPPTRELIRTQIAVIVRVAGAPIAALAFPNQLVKKPKRVATTATELEHT